jgi:hypothetical protein
MRGFLHVLTTGFSARHRSVAGLAAVWRHVSVATICVQFDCARWFGHFVWSVRVESVRCGIQVFFGRERGKATKSTELGLTFILFLISRDILKSQR